MIVKLHYYKNLTGVRAIAALLVMFLHFFNQLLGGFIGDPFDLRRL